MNNNKEDIFTIHVQLDGFRMPLNIRRDDEEIYRNAEKLVLSYLEIFQKKYSQRTYEELLKLVAFQLAVIQSKKEISGDIAPLAEKIQELEKELNKVLNL